MSIDMPRVTIAAALIVSACACAEKSARPIAETGAASCAYEIVEPDVAETASAFRTWLMPRAEELFGGTDVVAQGDVLIVDVDNDGVDELLFAWTEGSGSYLNMLLFRGAMNAWTLEEKLPFEEGSTSHAYAGALLDKTQLVARLCGQTVLNFMGGSEPNYYPHTLIWKGNAARRVCSAPWLNHHRAAAADLVKRDMLDEARVLLAGIRQGCDVESPAEVRDIDAEISRIAAATAAASAATYDFAWLIAAIKSDPGQQLVLDPRFGSMLVRIVPDARLEHISLRGALKTSVWLPGELKVIDDRYVMIGGCEPHNCGNRGFVWIDSVAKQGIAMTAGVLASKTTSASEIPPLFWEHTNDASDPWHDGTIEFIDAAGRRTKVAVP